MCPISSAAPIRGSLLASAGDGDGMAAQQRGAACRAWLAFPARLLPGIAGRSRRLADRRHRPGVAAGWVYTNGLRPIAYTPLGELFVLAFGFAAVGGSHYLQTLASACGSGGRDDARRFWRVISVNTRDLGTDARVGKNTLAGSAGRR